MLGWFFLSAVAITQGGAIQLSNNGTDGVQGLQTLTMTNAAATQPGTTILQYAQTTDGQQILVPSNQVVVQGEKLHSQSFCVRFSPCKYKLPTWLPQMCQEIELTALAQISP